MRRRQLRAVVLPHDDGVIPPGMDRRSGDEPKLRFLIAVISLAILVAAIEHKMPAELTLHRLRRPCTLGSILTLTGSNGPSEDSYLRPARAELLPGRGGRLSLFPSTVPLSFGQAATHRSIR